jgi:hypothetical protein
MEPNPEIFIRMNAIDWFNNCGKEPPTNLPFQTQRITDISSAIASALDTDWQEAGTAAQNDLTGYLAKSHYEFYGGHWNRLCSTIENHILNNIMPKISEVLAVMANEALSRMAVERLSYIVLLDLTRIAIHSAYKKHFRRIPDFYERLLKVYECGHLPCGWVGDIDLWPEGHLVVY